MNIVGNIQNASIVREPTGDVTVATLPSYTNHAHNQPASVYVISLFLCSSCHVPDWIPKVLSGPLQSRQVSVSPSHRYVLLLVEERQRAALHFNWRKKNPPSLPGLLFCSLLGRTWFREAVLLAGESLTRLIEVLKSLWAQGRILIRCFNLSLCIRAAAAWGLTVPFY